MNYIVSSSFVLIAGIAQSNEKPRARSDGAKATPGYCIEHVFSTIAEQWEE
jgi:hypothetical protein